MKIRRDGLEVWEMSEKLILFACCGLISSLLMSGLTGVRIIDFFPKQTAVCTTECFLCLRWSAHRGELQEVQRTVLLSYTCC